MKYYVEVPEVWMVEFLENDPDCAGYWVSSLTQSWQKGYPDNCTVPWTNYVDVVRRLRLHSDKKIIVDVDMLYNEPSIAATVARELYDVGCNTIVVESKRFPKVNSLTPDSMALSTPEEFSRLINKVKTTVPDLEVIARNEYLATTKNVDTTCDIARRALNAGADGVVVHWGGDSNTTLLKEALGRLKKEGIQTGIIPTKYLDQVVAGEYEELADFSILGNICTSYIRHSFSQQTVKSLLNTPCMFEPILDRVNSHEPTGQKTLVVLGAREDKEGKHLLKEPSVVNKFTKHLEDDYYSVILVADSKATDEISSEGNVQVAGVEDSVGEVHSLSAAMHLINTEKVTVAYADLNNVGFENIDASGMLFDGDNFAGVMNVKSDVLASMVQSVDPTSSIVKMGMENGIRAVVVNGDQKDLM